MATTVTGHEYVNKCLEHFNGRAERHQPWKYVLDNAFVSVTDLWKSVSDNVNTSHWLTLLQVVDMFKKQVLKVLFLRQHLV